MKIIMIIYFQFPCSVPLFINENNKDEISSSPSANSVLRHLWRTFLSQKINSLQINNEKYLPSNPTFFLSLLDITWLPLWLPRCCILDQRLWLWLMLGIIFASTESNYIKMRKHVSYFFFSKCVLVDFSYLSGHIFHDFRRAAFFRLYCARA